MSRLILVTVWTALLTALLTTSASGAAVKDGALFGYADEPAPKVEIPIVFIPGIGGSQIKYRHNDEAETPKSSCPRKREWGRLWLDLWTFVSGDVACWVEDMKLEFNSTSRESHNPRGLETVVPGWGDTSTIERLDTSWGNWILGDVSQYAAPFIKKLVEYGYVRGKTIRGAPYDFRLAPHSQKDYFRRLQHLIMQTSRMNNGSRIALVGHSMGGLYAHYFLTRMPYHWKRRYIHSMTTFSTPWYGTAIVPMLYVSGYAWGIAAIDPKKLREEQITHESSAFLLPRSGGFNDDEILIQSQERNYTILDYREFFNDINFTKGIDILETVLDKDYGRRWEHPEVDFYCMYSTGMDTMQSIHYHKPLSEHSPPNHVEMGSGDGTVNIKSLRGCGDFLSTSDLKHHPQRHEMWVRQLNGLTHDNIIDDQEAIDLLMGHLVENQPLTRNQRRNHFHKRLRKRKRLYRLVRKLLDN